jgi:DNA-binding transcriptional LysR family regulator
MRFNKLDLNLLVAMDALFTYRSVSRAAEQLHMSQPALSSSLARLREFFEDDLLVAVGRQMELTPRAELLQVAVRDVLARVNTTIISMPHFDPTKSDREFRVFVSDFSMTVLIPHMLALAEQSGSTSRFSFLPIAKHPRRILEDGDGDLLVVPATYCSDEHPIEALFEEEFCCVVWNESQHSRRGITLKQYAEGRHVVMRPIAAGHTAEFTILEEVGVRRNIEIMSYSFFSSPSLVVGTERIATVHRRLAMAMSAMLPISILPLPAEIEAKSMVQAMQWHKYRTDDPGLAWLRSLMHEAVQLMNA